MFFDPSIAHANRALMSRRIPEILNNGMNSVRKSAGVSSRFHFARAAPQANGLAGSRGHGRLAVMKRVVPRAETLETMARFVVERSSADVRRDELLESTVEKLTSAKHDPST